MPGFSGSSQAATCLEPVFVPCLEPVHPEVARLQGKLAAAGAKFAKRAKHDTWDAKETQEKSFALFKWLGLSSEVRGTSLLRSGARLLGLGAGELFDSTSDAFVAKSTSTCIPVPAQALLLSSSRCWPPTHCAGLVWDWTGPCLPWVRSG